MRGWKGIWKLRDGLARLGDGRREGVGGWGYSGEGRLVVLEVDSGVDRCGVASDGRGGRGGADERLLDVRRRVGVDASRRAGHGGGVWLLCGLVVVWCSGLGVLSCLRKSLAISMERMREDEGG